MEEERFTEKLRRFKKALRTFESELGAIVGVDDVEIGKPLLFPLKLIFTSLANQNVHAEPLPTPRGRDGGRLPLAFT